MFNQKRIILYLLVLALTIRLISLFTFDFIDSGGGSDTVTYLLLARNLFTGKGFTEFGLPHTVHHPFYPVLIGIFWKLSGDLLFAGKLIAVLSGAFLVIPVCWLGAYLFDARTAVFSGLLTAVFPVLVYGSTEPFCESLYTFLLISSMALLWVGLKNKKLPWLFPAGILLGMAFLTHPMGLSFVPLFIFFLFLVQFSFLKTNWRRFVLRVIVLIAGFVITCFPFWLRIHALTGKWQLSGSSHFQDLTLRLDQVEGMEEGEVIFRHMESLFQPSEPGEAREGMGMGELARSHPGLMVKIARFNLGDGFRELLKTARFLGLPPWLLIFFLAGGIVFIAAMVAVSFIRKSDRLSLVFLALMFLPMLTFVIVIIEHRYFYPFLPLALIVFSRFLSRGMFASEGKPGWRGLFNFGVWVLFLALTAGSVFVVYRKAAKISIPYEYKMMGEWMEEEIGSIEDEKVMMFRLGVSYYAGCRWNVFYWGNYPGLIAYLKEREIEYLLIDDYKLHMIHPDLRFLLPADPPPDEFELIKEFGFDGRKIRLLRFQGEE